MSNIKQGRGVKYYKNGDIYDGQFYNDLKSGKGIKNNIFKNIYIIY